MTNPRDIFVGVDGGGTKTIARVEDAEGALLGQGRGGPANVRLSVEGSWQSVLEAVAQALASAGLELGDERYRFHCGVGLAGTEVSSASTAFIATPHPFARLQLRSDGYISCLGAHGGEDGAIIAVGTGVVAYQVQAGREVQVSGWGFPHDDLGGGSWLGLQALRLTLQWLDGRHGSSPLLASVYAHFDQDLPRMVAWACEAKATQFAQLAPLVIDQARSGTALARELIQQAADEIDRVGEALSQRASGEALPCCLLGGIAPFVEPWLGTALRARLTPPQLDAAQGALLMIRRSLPQEPNTL